MSLLGSNDIKPYNEQVLTQNRITGGDITNQTNLLALADLKRQQETQAQLRAFYQQNPQMLLGEQSPQSTLGSLQTAPPGVMTDTLMRPGQPPQTQVVPPPMFGPGAAAPPGTTMPQTTLGGLAAPQQANPLLALAQSNPEAAMAVQQRQSQMQEQRLTMGTKVMEYIGRIAQSVKSQEDLDQARSEIARVSPQAAAQLPQSYSSDAMAPFIAKALDVKESLTLQVQDLQAQAAVIKARREGRSVDVDNQLRAMGVQPGQETPAQMREALQAVQEGKIAVSASHGTGQLVQTPTGIVRVNPRTGTVDPVEAPGGGPMYPKPTAEEQRAASYGDRAQAAHDTAVTLEEKGLTPGIWSKVGEALPFGLGNYLVGEDQQRYRQTVNQFAQAILRKESGAAISPTEYTMTERTYFPQPGDSKKVIDQKRQERARVIQSMQEEGKQTGRTGTQGQPTSQAPSAGPTSQAPAGSKVISRSALHAEADRRGVPRAQAEQQAKDKGYEVR